MGGQLGYMIKGRDREGWAKMEKKKDLGIWATTYIISNQEGFSN
jgi:hypothetical protein